MQAAFGAPIGGVLFSMEEACSFWSRKQAWRCFVTTILAVFTVSELSETGEAGIIVFTNVHTLNNYDWLRQFPFMVAVAALGGGLGAAFNALRRRLWSIRASRSRKFLRVGEALATIIFCVCAQFIFAHCFGQCVDRPATWPAEFQVRVPHTDRLRRHARHLPLAAALLLGYESCQHHSDADSPRLAGSAQLRPHARCSCTPTSRRCHTVLLQVRALHD